uniref:Cyclin N-terminal domain-containing protein n=1 Tax=Elaeophora elaphi TaxID=1147741 RepID=A0A0R3RXU9_9BILA
MYDEIDECLRQCDGPRAYQLIKELQDKGRTSNGELEYRLAQACYILSNFCLSDKNERYLLLEEAYLSCKSARKREVTNDEVSKWSAIVTGALIELDDLTDSEQVFYVKEFKEYLDEALAGPPDPSVYHMNGRFCYRVRHIHSFLDWKVHLCECELNASLTWKQPDVPDL